MWSRAEDKYRDHRQLQDYVERSCSGNGPTAPPNDSRRTIANSTKRWHSRARASEVRRNPGPLPREANMDTLGHLSTNAGSRHGA